MTDPDAVDTEGVTAARTGRSLGGRLVELGVPERFGDLLMDREMLSAAPCSRTRRRWGNAGRIDGGGISSRRMAGLS